MEGPTLSPDIIAEIRKFHILARKLNVQIAQLHGMGVNVNIGVHANPAPNQAPEQFLKYIVASHYIMIPQDDLREMLQDLREEELNDGDAH